MNLHFVINTIKVMEALSSTSDVPYIMSIEPSRVSRVISQSNQSASTNATSSHNDSVKSVVKI